ncbi:hypothetical protein SCHPADRAFT_288040 [Schizopora paradoxa]|uniref:F-box domain-containing protein n=1 Tax=Schizopora paradoxa TaxID=27342 RepID=A0A0H2RT41_9AGAM|nr:hypothetical protein SCHPADRAFT_288040 [Schizopora paradoxa]
MTKRRQVQKDPAPVFARVNGAPKFQAATGYTTRTACAQVLFLPELLGRIISFTISERDTALADAVIEESNIPTHSMYPPWPMMLVCRQWRDIVISTPELWSTFIADFSGCSVSDMRHVPRMLDAHLRLSRSHPLTMSFYLATESWANIGGQRILDVGGASPTEMMFVLMEKARAHRHRWKHFSVRVDSTQSYDNPLWLMVVDNDPIRSRLKHLRMGANLDPHRPYTNHQVQRPPPLDLPPYQGLESLHITGPFVVSVQSSGRLAAPLSFPSLRVLRFESHDVNSLCSLWKILQESPSLEEAHLAMELPFGPIPNILSPISLSNLKHLQLSAKIFDVAMTVFSQMNLSSLIGLELSNVPFLDLHLRRLAQVLRTCNAPFKKCSLYVFGVSTPSNAFKCLEAFAEVLNSMPQVEHLELAWTKSPPIKCLPAFMHRVLTSILWQKQGTFLPSLTLLSIDTDVQDVLSNSSSSTHLRSLIVACRRKYQKSIQKFRFGITSNIAVSKDVSTKFEDMLLQDVAVGECIKAENFEVLVKF